MKRVDTAAQDISLAVLNGTFKSGEHVYELANGGVDIAPTQDLLSEEVIAAVEDAKAAIIAGEVTVPSTNRGARHAPRRAHLHPRRLIRQFPLTAPRR